MTLYMVASSEMTASSDMDAHQTAGDGTHRLAS